MDRASFDAFARAVATAPSRRAMLAALVGAAVAGLPGETEGKGCPPCRKNKRGGCKKKRPNGTRCPGGACRGGHCRCIPATPAFGVVFAPCGGDGDCCAGGTCCTFADGPACLDLSTNQTACGTVCADVENCLNFSPVRVCADGVCVLP